MINVEIILRVYVKAWGKHPVVLITKIRVKKIHVEFQLEILHLLTVVLIEDFLSDQHYHVFVANRECDKFITEVFFYNLQGIQIVPLVEFQKLILKVVEGDGFQGLGLQIELYHCQFSPFHEDYNAVQLGLRISQNNYIYYLTFYVVGVIMLQKNSFLRYVWVIYYILFSVHSHYF